MGLPVILILYTTVRIMIKMMIGEKIQRMAQTKKSFSNYISLFYFKCSTNSTQIHEIIKKSKFQFCFFTEKNIHSFKTFKFTFECFDSEHRKVRKLRELIIQIKSRHLCSTLFRISLKNVIL